MTKTRYVKYNLKIKKKTNIQNRNTIQNICVLIIIDNLPTT